MMIRKITYIAVILLLVCAGNAQAKSLTYGTGPVRIILFTDFFCPPCQRLESSIEASLYKALVQGKITVTYVPVPITKMSVPVAYYYIATADGKTYEDAATIRKNLTNMAKSGIINDNLLEQWKKKAGVVQPYIQYLNDTIKHYGITSTPSCVIGMNGREVTYTGSQDIENAILSVSR